MNFYVSASARHCLVLLLAVAMRAMRAMFGAGAMLAVVCALGYWSHATRAHSAGFVGAGGGEVNATGNA